MARDILNQHSRCKAAPLYMAGSLVQESLSKVEVGVLRSTDSVKLLEVLLPIVHKPNDIGDVCTRIL